LEREALLATDRAEAVADGLGVSRCRILVQRLVLRHAADSDPLQRLST
jgi:hypothetical protein